MNYQRFFAAIVFTLTIVACQESRDELRNPLSETDLYKTIGEEIPFDVGMEWIEFYNRKQQQQGRFALVPTYSVSAAQLDSALESTTNLVGVAFHHAIDDQGNRHILIIPVNDSMRLWSANAGRILLDANSGNPIGLDTARAWTQKYMDENPNKTWFHFFGADVFDDIRALPFFDNVLIQPAINVLNLTPQLLLVVMNDDLLPFGRTADDPGMVYDASNACPPCAVR